MDELYVNSRVRIKKNVVMHLKRHVPGGAGGTVKVSVGQEVYPEDILGEGQTYGGFRTIHLAHQLDVSPKQAPTFLTRSLTQKIYQGEILAKRSSLWGVKNNVLISPVDGILDYYDEVRGELRIKLLPKVLKMVSGVYGVVDRIDEYTGSIMIKSLSDVVYGIFGSGKERDGILRVLGTAETLVSSRQIESYMSNQILVGGAMIFSDALEKALSTQVTGFITGGINAKDFRSTSGGRWNVNQQGWSDVGMSLMVTEGFGSIPMGSDIFDLLRRYDGRFVIIDGNRSRLILPSGDQNSMINIRKTQLPGQSYIETQPELDAAVLKTGVQVRVVAEPYVGMQGEIVEIDHVPTQLPSGISTFLVTIESSKRKIRVPYLNLEMIAENA